jgi:hypothetical protein
MIFRPEMRLLRIQQKVKKDQFWSLWGSTDQNFCPNDACMACGFETSENFKFQMLALWYSIEFHADDENTLEFLF